MSVRASSSARPGARLQRPLWILVALLLLAVPACGDDAADADADADTDVGPDSAEAPWEPPPRRPCDDDSDCGDDDACTWDERCADDGLCAFRVITCDDFDECTSDTCDPALGCVFEPFDGACDDGDPCTLGDTCSGGLCGFVETVSCDDDNPCTRDTCDRDTGACTHEPESDLENLACDDGDACTTRGRCDTGRCVYDPVECPSDTTCSDWACDPAEGCVATPLEGACNDGDVCTTGDSCAAGECAGGPARVCSDGDACTDDTCDPQTGCVFPHNTASCEDGIACTTGDTCLDGGCRSGASSCDDDNPCTVDICDAAEGCKHFPTAGPCDDDDPCTVGDYCAAGICVVGPTARCDDDKQCTVDVCTPNGEAWSCSNALNATCLDDDVAGNYFGLFHFGFDQTAADPDDFDCFGTATAALVAHDDGVDVIGGSASCTWDLSLNADRTVLVQFSARDTGEKPFLDLGDFTVHTRRFAGTLTASGALLASVPVDIYVTANLGDPTILIFVDGATATAPPANQPKPLSMTFELEVSDLEVPLCCTDDACFPGDPALCASVGAQPVAVEASGPCCLDLPSGVTCVDTPAAWCAATPNAIYHGPSPSACCLASGCALLSEDDCTASGGAYAEALGCGDADSDGFADVCPAPPGCAQPGVATCSVAGKILSVAPTGFHTIPLRAEGSWTPAGDDAWSTNLPFWITVGGQEIPIPVLPPGLVTVSCAGAVSITGTIDIPDLSFAGFDLSAPEAETPSFELGFGLGQDLAHLNAPLADCRTYIFFEGTSRFTVGSGDDASVLNEGSHVVMAVDPFDPAFYAHGSGEIIDGPTGGLASRVGFGVSRGGHLKWVSDFAVPPAGGGPPRGVTLHGHVFATGDMGVIPIAGSPVQIEVDGESVYDLGPYPEAAEAVLLGVLAGDVDAIGGALVDLGTGLSSGQVLDELAYGVNAHEIRLVVEDEATFTLGRGTLVAADGAVRFAAEVGSLGVVLPDDVPPELTAALSRFGVQQVYNATGVIDAGGFELNIVADLTIGPVVLEGAGLRIRYRDGDWSLDIDEPGLSLDFLGWLSSLEDFLGCELGEMGASCSVGGVPVGSIAIDTSGGRVKVTMMATLPTNMGTVMFSADVTQSGDFVFTGNAVIPLGPLKTTDTTLVLTQEGVRVIATLTDISYEMTFDGMVWFDGSFVLTGLGSMGALGFVTLAASATFSWCPVGSKCAAEGHPTGDVVMLLTGDVDTPVGTATLQGELILEEGNVTYDLQGMADFDIGGYAGLDGTMRVTNIGTPGAYLHMDMDVALVEATIDGELFADGSFVLEGTGSLKIPGFSDLATATVRASSSAGVEVASSLGVAGARLDFAGRVGPNGFSFTGANNVQLLGFALIGQATFTGSTSAADFRFAGGVYVGGSRLEVTGAVSSGGQFSFTGTQNINLFGHPLSQGSVTFDNTGLSVAGRLNIANVATFQMSGRIESDLDFLLTASATAVTFPGGLNGQLTASLRKQGHQVTVRGDGYASFLGQRAQGGFSMSSTGQFSFYGAFGFDWSSGSLSLDGDVRLSVSNSGFSASAHGRGCADFAFDKGCASVGGSVDSSGRVCVRFPIAGRKCIDIL